MKHHLVFTLGILLAVAGCKTENDNLIQESDTMPLKGAVKTSKMLIGDAADVTTNPSGGTCLMGGSTDVDAAFKWMIGKSGGGDFVVIRADNSTGYNSYIYNLVPGGVNSVETIVISRSTDAKSTVIAQKIRNAEALFIAGGDQKNYVTVWKNTLVEDAIKYLIASKHVPVGGTSAGCAILGSSYFSALNGTVTSEEALANPFSSLITLGHDDFISIPCLTNTITDQHFTQRSRQGRLITFMARMQLLGKTPRGIGVDEQTAVCADESGAAEVFGLNSAYFLSSDTSPETCSNGVPLNWNSGGLAIKAYKIQGTTSGAGSVNLNDFSTATGGTSFYYYVDNGVLH